MRSFIACDIPDRCSRAQIGFDQFVDKRYGREIKSYFKIWQDGDADENVNEKSNQFCDN